MTSAHHRCVTEIKTLRAETFRDFTANDGFEQLSGFQSRIARGAVPYVDLSLMCPYGQRFQTKLKLKGRNLHSSGEFKMVEISGPPTYQDWDACYELLITGLVGFKVFDLGNLLGYHVRVREFDSALPRNAVWSRTAEDDRFWKKELEDPALLILARTKGIGSVLGLDSADLGRGTKCPPPPGDPPTHQEKKQPRLRIHNVTHGKFFTTRKGVILCNGFNSGKCMGSRLGCPSGSGEAHACNMCLSSTHAGHECSLTPRCPTRQAWWQGAKGKGKGKKGGGKAQY